MSVSSAEVRVPAPREDPLGLPVDYTRLRETEPVSRVSMPNGQEAWLVTRHAEARAVLAEPELFSSDRRQEGKPKRTFNDVVVESILFLDPPDHTRLRGLIAGRFAGKRMAALAPRARQITDDLLDDMICAGPPADLVTAVNEPVPLRVICEILGAPFDDHALFHQWVDVATNFGEQTEDNFQRTMADFRNYMEDVVAAKRRDPGDDLISELVGERDGNGSLSHDELISLSILLMIAGHDNTAATLGLGEIMLITEPDQFARLATDDAALTSAVEEVLRHQAIVHLGRPRVATRDCEVGGTRIRKGDAVVVMLPAANRDPRVFDDPERFDISRKPNPHIGFGHGIHHCVGHALARMELRAVFERLAARLPGLRLAEPVAGLGWRQGYNAYGVRTVPVTW